MLTWLAPPCLAGQSPTVGHLALVTTTYVEPALLTPRRSGVGKQGTAARLTGRARGPLAWTALGGPGLEREVSRADWMTTHVEPARLTPPGIPASERATSREVEHSGL